MYMHLTMPLNQGRRPRNKATNNLTFQNGPHITLHLSTLRWLTLIFFVTIGKSDIIDSINIVQETHFSYMK